MLSLNSKHWKAGYVLFLDSQTELSILSNSADFSKCQQQKISGEKKIKLFKIFELSMGYYLL